MNKFEESVKLYAELDAQEKEIKKSKKPLNQTLKDELKARGLKKYEQDGITLDFNIQERTNMNEDKLLMKLKDLGFDSAIKTVEKPDQSEIERLIYEGKLSSVELDDCIEKKHVEVLKVKVKK